MAYYLLITRRINKKPVLTIIKTRDYVSALATRSGLKLQALIADEEQVQAMFPELYHKIERMENGVEFNPEVFKDSLVTMENKD